MEGEEPAEVAEDEGEPAPEGFSKVFVTEETRLAYTIAAIDFAAAVVPNRAANSRGPEGPAGPLNTPLWTSWVLSR